MKKILWSQTAQDDYWDNIDFLLNKWTETEATHFINEVENTIEILRQGNVSFKATGYKNTYQITMVKQITLYYHLNQNNDIELLRFFNNLQNPDKLNL
ncbi:type II toxin-antitoxin system RelE/ParE family toxin [Flavobacterium dauae]|uniref:type II toxin-antitoxin system RelE/ParE family toxin n=1 Tax=Flavobacterium dauae TaxID=1563479 RepID=UPI00101B47E3|nr:type II toxin-antitoxin system RelE/ParE family toxin [Flavobacterium dauae]WLD24532.1 type II toxin-antitoxin system RelE/ParE family toxin [Flavobacterium dauae]